MVYNPLNEAIKQKPCGSKYIYTGLTGKARVSVNDEKFVLNYRCPQSIYLSFRWTYLHTANAGML